MLVETLPIATNPPAKTEVRAASIDILRALAVFGTIYQHTYFQYTNSQQWHWDIGGRTIYPFIFANGWLGVNLFFILSGFVLYRPEFLGSGPGIWAYYRARAMRLWPLLIVVSFSFILFETRDAYSAVGLTALYCTGLNNLIPALWFPSLGVLWSIGVEILFSVALPGIIWLQCRFGFWRASGVIIVLCLGYRCAADAIWFQIHPEWYNRLINPLKDNIFGRLDDFIIGMIAARCCRDYSFRFSARTTFGAAVLMGITLYGWNVVWAVPRTGLVSTTVGVLHLLFSTSALVLVCAFYRASAESTRWLAPLVLVGQMCYSIYLFQAYLLRLSPSRFDFATLSGLAGFLLVTLLVSFCTFVLIEARGIHRKPSWLAALERRWL